MTHIEAMKQALAEFENQKAGFDEEGISFESINECITSLRQAIAEESSATQEPVAFQDTAKHDELVSAEDWENISPKWHWMYRPLYTHPQPKAEQQPKREPLTHEQRFDLLTAFESHNNKWEAPAILIDMVEAAHGIIKNYPEKDKT